MSYPTPRTSDAPWVRSRKPHPARPPADRGTVVVPADRSDVPLPQDLQHLVRPWVVSDEVPRHPDAIRGDAIDVGQDRLQGVKVRVDVRKDRESHNATERARSISGSQHEMRIFTSPWRRPGPLRLVNLIQG